MSCSEAGLLGSTQPETFARLRWRITPTIIARGSTLSRRQRAYYMSKVEEIPLQTGASKCDEAKGGGLRACVGVKDIIIVVLVVIVV